MWLDEIFLSSKLKKMILLMIINISIFFYSYLSTLKWPFMRLEMQNIFYAKAIEHLLCVSTSQLPKGEVYFFTTKSDLLDFSSDSELFVTKNCKRFVCVCISPTISLKLLNQFQNFRQFRYDLDRLVLRED